jgi:hypothetical protein
MFRTAEQFSVFSDPNAKSREALACVCDGKDLLKLLDSAQRPLEYLVPLCI